ncbi:MAG: Anhydro-N-acetylmuramic acid kinase [Spirochaetes bacterium ADurb.Bin110]|nr:MAG: Anhydro-N-acetylmuramic acid kinase [Spirochaetes bacterium ADurb.Bin110]
MQSNYLCPLLGRFKDYSSRKNHLLIGVMSGTSFDGIDAVAVNISTNCDGSITKVQYLDHATLPYSQEVKNILLPLCDVQSCRIDDFVYAHFLLGEWYAEAIQKLIDTSGLKADAIDAVCIHGQTIWHAPTLRKLPGPKGELSTHGTLQIGCAAVIKERLCIPVVYDFRAADMAAGGEGAPLAPVVDSLLFGHPTRGRVVQNIGGIGNATAIPAGPKEDGVFAFDTGPGNMIIDELVRRFTHGAQEYDDNGAIARSGQVSPELLAYMLDDPFFALSPPKSTGREVYGSAYVNRLESFAAKKHLSYEDMITTATAFTAESITHAYRDFIIPSIKIDDVVVSGGGALNSTLLDMLRERLPADISVLTTMDFGYPAFVREPLAFAVMGHESLMGHPGNLPIVTGARKHVILGSITL